MAGTVISRARNAWNVFLHGEDREPTRMPGDNGFGYVMANSWGRRPDKTRYTHLNSKSLVLSIYNRIALDVASINTKHVTVDENGRYTGVLDTKLNQCLTLEANIDQTSRAFMTDAVLSMFDEGVIAVVPVDTVGNPDETSSYDIETMRVGKILDWYPRDIKVRLYNDRRGEFSDVMCPKSTVAIIENPLYAVINEPNSTTQRLIRKLNLLDTLDNDLGSDKINMIIQLPYAIKSEMQEDRARRRLQSVEKQMHDNPHGIAYIDATEKITQLNRPLDNNLLEQIKYLTEDLYAQLGLTQEILNGSADEKSMLNYTNRTIEPIVAAFTDEMTRKFLTKNARTRGQRIMYFRDPFKLVPVDNIAEIADKFTRNEILAPNEVRQVIGMMPSEDPKSDQLRNRNISESTEQVEETIDVNEEEGNSQNGFYEEV